MQFQNYRSFRELCFELCLKNYSNYILFEMIKMEFKMKSSKLCECIIPKLHVHMTLVFQGNIYQKS